MASLRKLTSALPPPPGQTSNFDNPVTLWKWDVLCVTICLVFTTVAFLLRTYTRLFVKPQWIFEDWMACLAWAGFVTYCGLMTTVMANHGGSHEWDLTVPQVQEALYWFNITSIEYGIEILITKLTILMLYRRVFMPRRWSAFDIILRLFETILILFYVAISIVKVFECTPRARIWDRKIPGTCTNIAKILNTSGLFNFITDVLILLVPVQSVWNLQMKRKLKIQVVAVFTLGLIAPVFSMIGFVVRLQDSASPDATYNQPFVLLWGTAELSTGVICVCLPSISVLLHPRQRGPTVSILNGNSNSRRPQQSRPKQSSGHNGLDLYHEEYLQLTESVITGIKGGAHPSMMQDDGHGLQGTTLADSTEKVDESAQGSKITKTVEIEQSYA